MYVMASVYSSQRLICNTIGQRQQMKRNVGRWSSLVSLTAGAAKVDTVSSEPVIESVVYEV